MGGVCEGVEEEILQSPLWGQIWTRSMGVTEVQQAAGYSEYANK